MSGRITDGTKLSTTSPRPDRLIQCVPSSRLRLANIVFVFLLFRRYDETDQRIIRVVVVSLFSTSVGTTRGQRAINVVVVVVVVVVVIALALTSVSIFYLV